MTAAPIVRPGISSAMLSRAGVLRVTAEQAHAAVGFATAGLLIPYHTRNGDPVQIDGKPFARVRLDNPTTSAKYLSPARSGCRLYEPPGLRALLLPGCVLQVVEGEFKALALVEAGFAAVGIGGITSATPRAENGNPEILPALRELIAEVRPSKIAFVGDSDTALIPDFAREAVKLAAAAGVPVVLPRIPLNSPGKAADDLRELWGDSFAARWREILDSAESFTAATKPSALAVRLLRREREHLGKLEGDALDTARARCVKLAAAVAGDPLAAAEVEQIAADCLHITKAIFRAAAKAAAEEQATEAAARAAEAATADLALDGASPLYFDGTAYWRREANEVFGKLCREDVRLHLNQAGLSKTGDPSPADSALHALQVSNRVDFAGPLCGRPAGLHHENGLAVLATRGPAWIGGKPGDCSTVLALIGNLLGRAAGDPLAPKQAALFLAWLKLAREAVRHPEHHRPGQVLGLVGPPDCGKSLLQAAIVTPALGGRVADPGLFFTGQSTFNAELWGAEHLAMGDKALDVDGAQRSTLRNELKRVVAESVYPLHGKCRDALNFRPVWRVTLSANDDPESASNLPAIDASFADKILYLRCYAPPAPFYDDTAPGAREVFSAKIRAELPAFFALVDSFEIPAEIRKARFGVVEWHHPLILELLDAGDPLRPVSDVLQKWCDSWAQAEASRELPTVELFTALDDALDGKLARHRISSGPKHLGHQLAKLATTPEWRGRLTSTTRRVGGRSLNRPQACWLIAAREEAA